MYAEDDERAFVLINVRPDTLNNVQSRLLKNPNITIADIVYGPYDIIALITVKDKKKITDVVLQEIRSIDGIVETLTCIKVK